MYINTFYGLKKKFPNAICNKDYVLLCNDGKTIQIKDWKLADPIPSLDELEILGQQYRQELAIIENNKKLMRSSAINKLISLGLTSEEINALLT